MLSEKQILLLSSLPKIGKKTILKIGQSFDLLDKDDYDFRVWLITWALENSFDQINDATIEQGVSRTNEILEKSRISKISLIGYWNIDFPDHYRTISDPPILIYVAGDIGALKKQKKVAIIGTREPSQFGLKAGRRLAEIFASHGFVVVSGLAKGCDTVAHEGCIAGHGQTIAVMAHGLDTIYPKENMSLAVQIVKEHGALVSEYPIGQRALSHFFVERDRLQSGICDATIVIETDIKGGTMHTVKFTEQNGKLLACLKHPEKYLDHPKVNGNLMLMREGRAIGLETQEDIEAFIHKIHEKLGLLEVANEDHKETLFDLGEFTIDDIDSSIEIKQKKVIKRGGKNSGKQGIIWE